MQSSTMILLFPTSIYTYPFPPPPPIKHPMNDAQGSARFYQALDMPSMRRCVPTQCNHPPPLPSPPTLGFYSLHWIFSSTLTGRLFLYYTLLHLRKYTTIFCRSRIISDLFVFTPVCVCFAFCTKQTTTTTTPISPHA